MGEVYSLLPLLVVGWLTVRHVRSPRASVRSKRVVVGLIAGSFLLTWVVGGLVAIVLALLIQLGTGVYLALHEVVSSVPDDPGSSR